MKQKRKMKKKLLIGIDPGAKTGIAARWSDEHDFNYLATHQIHEAFEYVRAAVQEHGAENVFVVIEDARKRSWFGGTGEERFQGAGAIKRESRIWEDFIKTQGVRYIMEHAQKKISKEYFKRITGWNRRSSQHARDAAMLIFGYNNRNIHLYFK